MSGRDTSGRFAPGNKFGIGRPKRAVELDYLAALSDVVPVETWQAVVKRAVDDALNGDDKARMWLTRYLLGDTSRLGELAQLDVLGATPADYIAAVVDADVHPNGDIPVLQNIANGENMMQRLARIVKENEKNE